MTDRTKIITTPCGQVFEVGRIFAVEHIITTDNKISAILHIDGAQRGVLVTFESVEARSDWCAKFALLKFKTTTQSPKLEVDMSEINRSFSNMAYSFSKMCDSYQSLDFRQNLLNAIKKGLTPKA